MLSVLNQFSSLFAQTDRFTRVNSRKALCPKACDTASSHRYLPLGTFRQRAVRGGWIADYASHILSTLRGLVKCIVDRCNISNYLLRDTNRKLAIPVPQTNVKQNSFSGAVLWNSLPIYWLAAGEVSWGFEGRLETILLEIYKVPTKSRLRLSVLFGLLQRQR